MKKITAEEQIVEQVKPSVDWQEIVQRREKEQLKKGPLNESAGLAAGSPQESSTKEMEKVACLCNCGSKKQAVTYEKAPSTPGFPPIERALSEQVCSACGGELKYAKGEYRCVKCGSSAGKHLTESKKQGLAGGSGYCDPREADTDNVNLSAGGNVSQSSEPNLPQSENVLVRKKKDEDDVGKLILEARRYDPDVRREWTKVTAALKQTLELSQSLDEEMLRTAQSDWLENLMYDGPMRTWRDFRKKKTPIQEGFEQTAPGSSSGKSPRRKTRERAFLDRFIEQNTTRGKSGKVRLTPRDLATLLSDKRIRKQLSKQNPGLYNEVKSAVEKVKKGLGPQGQEIYQDILKKGDYDELKGFWDHVKKNQKNPEKLGGSWDKYKRDLQQTRQDSEKMFQEEILSETEQKGYDPATDPYFQSQDPAFGAGPAWEPGEGKRLFKDPDDIVSKDKPLPSWYPWEEDKPKEEEDVKFSDPSLSGGAWPPKAPYKEKFVREPSEEEPIVEESKVDFGEGLKEQTPLPKLETSEEPVEELEMQTPDVPAPEREVTPETVQQQVQKIKNQPGEAKKTELLELIKQVKTILTDTKGLIAEKKQAIKIIFAVLSDELRNQLRKHVRNLEGDLRILENKVKQETDINVLDPIAQDIGSKMKSLVELRDQYLQAMEQPEQSEVEEADDVPLDVSKEEEIVEKSTPTELTVKRSPSPQERDLSQDPYFSEMLQKSDVKPELVEDPLDVEEQKRRVQDPGSLKRPLMSEGGVPLGIMGPRGGWEPLNVSDADNVSIDGNYFSYVDPKTGKKYEIAMKPGSGESVSDPSLHRLPIGMAPELAQRVQERTSGEPSKEEIEGKGLLYEAPPFTEEELQLVQQSRPQSELDISPTQPQHKQSLKPEEAAQLAINIIPTALDPMAAYMAELQKAQQLPEAQDPSWWQNFTNTLQSLIGGVRVGSINVKEDDNLNAEFVFGPTWSRIAHVSTKKLPVGEYEMIPYSNNVFLKKGALIWQLK